METFDAIVSSAKLIRREVVRRFLSVGTVAVVTVSPVLVATSSAANALVVSKAAIAPHLTAAPLTFVVNTTFDTTDISPGNTKCLDNSGKCSLRAAVEEANALTRPVLIKLASATYPTTLGALNLASQYGITISGNGSAATKIDASVASDRAIFLSAQDATAVISNLTISGGTALSGGLAADDGGNIVVAKATDSLTLNSVVVSHGTSSSNGGGIYNNGAMWINNSTISSNSVTSQYQASGGGIYQDAGTLVVSKTNFANNSAIGTGNDKSQGGALYSNRGTEIVGGSFTNNSALSTKNTAAGGALFLSQQTSIAGATFTGNTAGPFISPTNVTAYGGAIFSCYGGSLFSHLIVTHNSATSVGSGNAFGGGIDIDCGATILSSPTISHNTVSALGTGDAYGGGLSVGDTRGPNDSAIVIITKATISSNTAVSTSSSGNGGGISIYSGQPGSGGVTISDSVINSNHANSVAGITGPDVGGGGIFDRSCGAGSIITNSTLAFNVALNSQGGGLYNGSCGDTLINDKILSNQALGSVGTSASDAEGVGGGLSLYDTTRVVNTLVANNTATQLGGGVYSDDVQQFIGDTIRANHAHQGAGLFIDYSGTYRTTAIVDNVGTGVASEGGGIYFHDYANFFNSTIAGNSAASGAGIFALALTGGVLRATLLAGNHLTGTSTENDCHLQTAGLIGSAGGNRVGDASCSLHAVQDRQGKSDNGYNVVSSTGRVFNFNTTSYGAGSSVATSKTGAFVGIANSPDGQGYWTVSAHGHVFAYGSATNYGSAAGQNIVAITGAPDGQGYWLLGANGVVHAFGSAGQFGNAPTPAVAMAATPDGEGYWIVGTNGVVSHFGSASALGSAFGKHVVAIAASPDGQGYWLAMSNGAVSNFGTAGAHGSSPGKSIVGIAAAPDGQGFWLLGSNGAIYAHGNEPLKGSPLVTFHSGGHVSSIGSM